MANSQYQDNQAMLNTLFYDSHKSLVERVCMALGQTSRTEEMVELLLGEQVKMKFKKDPNKPKKPKSGFLFFCDEHRPKMIESQKKKKKKVVIGDIAKELGKKWKKLNDAQKAKYAAMNEKDKERYNKELEVYNNKIYQLSEQGASD